MKMLWKVYKVVYTLSASYEMSLEAYAVHSLTDLYELLNDCLLYLHLKKLLSGEMKLYGSVLFCFGVIISVTLLLKAGSFSVNFISNQFYTTLRQYIFNA